MGKLNTDNAEILEYSNEILRQTVLGGIKLEGLDRMRVTLKIELIDSSRPPVRHNLDLYNDNQLEKLIRRVAERMEIGTSVIAATLSELTEELEKYRLEEIKRQESTDVEKLRLTDSEIKQATSYLQTENLLSVTTEDLQQTGTRFVAVVLLRFTLYSTSSDFEKY